ncbi:MAG: DNA translocase FtsK 4TM domain-containing protein [SAR324 cluster bacterium]|nr:DNA translocase FtsK 4TM domain-containing protein [SAR324 cluster bacterium]
MSIIKLRIDYLVFGGLGFAFLLSIMTADFQDPTVFNQLYPSAGIQNWIGLIGAITGGSLLEIFGPSSLLLPWLFVRIFLHQPRSVSVLGGTYYTFVLVFLLSIFYELALQLTLLEPVNSGFLWQNGYAGKLAVEWLGQSMALALSSTALAVMFIISVVRMSRLLSPLPLFSALLTGIQNILMVLVNKISPPAAPEYLPAADLANFKGHSRFEENSSVS